MQAEKGVQKKNLPQLALIRSENEAGKLEVSENSWAAQQRKLKQSEAPGTVGGGC